MATSIYKCIHTCRRRLPSINLIRYASSTGSSGDSRHTIARRVILESPPSPTLTLTPEDQIRHETIHRAWILHERNREKRRMNALKAQQSKMQDACDTLQKIRPALFNKLTARRRGESQQDLLFPPRLRIPAEHPSSKGWNYGWKRATWRPV